MPTATDLRDAIKIGVALAMSAVTPPFDSTDRDLVLLAWAESIHNHIIAMGGGGGVTLPINESDVTGLEADLATIYGSLTTLTVEVGGRALLVHTHAASDITGLAAVATSGLASDLSGTLAAAQMPALTGDVTTSAGTVATTIAPHAVSNAKLAQGPALSLVGVAGNATADRADITAGSDGGVMRRDGTAIGFGAIPETSVTNLVSDLASKRPRSEPAPNSHTFSATFELAAGDTLVIPRYVKISDGVTLTIGDDADLVIP